MRKLIGTTSLIGGGAGAGDPTGVPLSVAFYGDLPVAPESECIVDITGETWPIRVQWDDMSPTWVVIGGIDGSTLTFTDETDFNNWEAEITGEGIATSNDLLVIVDAGPFAPSDLGDANVWTPATYDPEPNALAADGDYQIPIDTNLIYLRSAGPTWTLVGKVDGPIQVADISTFTNDGDEILDGLTIEDTDTGIVYEWNDVGSAWDRLSPTAYQEFAAGVTGARLNEMIAAGEATVHVGGAYVSTSGTMLRMTLDGTAAEQRVVITFELPAPTHQVEATGRMQISSGGADPVRWEAVCGWLVDDGSTDFATANLIEQGASAVSLIRRVGGACRDATNARRLVERDGSSVISTLSGITGAQSLQSSIVDGGSIRSVAAMQPLAITSSGERTTEVSSAVPLTPRWVWILVARARSGGSIVIDLHAASGGVS